MSSFDRSVTFSASNEFFDAEIGDFDPDETFAAVVSFGVRTTESKAYRVVLLDIVPTADVEIVLVAEQP